MNMYSVVDVNADDWEREVLKYDKMAIVEFWHDQCIWCKRLEPIYNEVSKEYENKVKFAKLNVLASHENQNIATEYGIMGTPTLIFFCNGRPVETAVGFQPKERLKQLVDSVIAKAPECIEQSTQFKP